MFSGYKRTRPNAETFMALITVRTTHHLRLRIFKKERKITHNAFLEQEQLTPQKLVICM
jgi:hypothetical protein